MLQSVTSRLAVAVLAVLAVLPATAQAGWKVDRATAIARIVWDPPCPKLTIAVERPPAHAGAPTGWAFEDVCVVHINAKMRSLRHFEPFCTTVLHETGHVAGWRDPVTGAAHASRSGSVMFAGMTFANINGRWDGTDRRCRDRGRPYLERHGVL